jgi:hypothetical protein
VGDPLLLLEAASSYRGDLEDRLTEVLATALSEHDGFCRALLARVGVLSRPTRLEVKTQESFPDGPARIDVVIRGYSALNTPTVVVFIENKYNPRKLPSPYWFDDDQAGRQVAALSHQPGEEHRLVAIASDIDLRRYDVPDEYAPQIGWREIADLANAAGGADGWQLQARRADEPASQRVLVEFWAYLKGDTVGALDEDDLFVLGQTVRAEDRVEALLERAAEQLEWDATVDDEWFTAGGAPIQYINGDAPEDSWLSTRRDGSVYALVSGGAWTDGSPVGEPQLYAGLGFSAKREERDAVAKSVWTTSVAATGLVALFESDGIYVFSQRALREIVESASSLSAQVNLVVTWVAAVVATALALPEPPELAEHPKPSGRRLGSRRTSK